MLVEPGVLDEEAKFQTKVARKHNMEKFKEFLNQAKTESQPDTVPQHVPSKFAVNAAGNSNDNRRV